jgi:HEAT repeat protein
MFATTRWALALLLIGAAPRPVAANFDWIGKVAVDAEALQSDDPKRREAAVVQLGNYDIALSERYLTKALTDDDPGVRHQAAIALGRGGAVAAVPVMIEWLADPEPKTRKDAADVLGDLGGPLATSALTRSLGDADPIVRQHAVKALGAIGRRGNPQVVIALIPRLEDDKADVRRETVDQLAAQGDRRAVIPLVARFGDTSLEVRKAAIQAIGKLGDPAAVPALIRLITDPAEDARIAAVTALGNLAAVDSLDALTEQLSSGSDLFRAKVAYAIGQIAAAPGSGKAGDGALRLLVGGLRQAAQRTWLTEALRVAGKAAVPALVASLGGRLEGDPTTAVRLLGEAADGRATAALTAELERGRVAMPLVLQALGATGDPAALVPVLGALAARDAAIRVAALEALRPLLGRDARAADVLLEHLGDDDLEGRVLTIEALGLVGAGIATPRLVGLVGAGNPPRVRRAAIEALGEVARPIEGAQVNRHAAEAATALVGVLRDGPAELHGAAATSLSYLAEPAVLPALLELARSDRGPTRDETVRAIGAILRGHDDAAARAVVRGLIDDGSLKVGVAAIAALAASGNVSEAPGLRAMLDKAAPERRRAAAWALGELRDVGSIPALIETLGVHDDRVVADAAWALGEIVAANPGDAHADPLIERWLYLARHGGWATAIDSSGALARVLAATPAAGRATRLAGPRRAALIALTFHRSRLVRINAVHALHALGAERDVVGAIAPLAHDDPSPHVRATAVAALARLAAEHPPAPVASALATALALAAKDPDGTVRVAAQVAAAAASIGRAEWRSYRVVDPGADDAPVRQEPYFVHGDDGVVWAAYTDARGELTTEHASPGDAIVWPASREGEY